MRHSLVNASGLPLSSCRVAGVCESISGWCMALTDMAGAARRLSGPALGPFDVPHWRFTAEILTQLPAAVAVSLNATANPGFASLITNVVQTWAMATGQTEASVRSAFGVAIQAVGAPLSAADTPPRLVYNLAIGLGAGAAFLAIMVVYYLRFVRPARFRTGLGLPPERPLR